MLRKLGWPLFLCALMFARVAFGALPQPSAETYTVSGGNDIPLLHFAAGGPDLVLWLPSESGLLSQEKAIAAHLAARGVDVWYADMFSAYFLPTLASSIDRMPGADIAALIEHLRQRTGKRIYLLSSGRGALLALRGAHAWQMAHPRDKPLGGAILISPKLYVQTPEPGMRGTFAPVVSASNLPLLVLQPDKSVWRWKMHRILPALATAGSDVYAWYLPDVRDRFYYRPEATAAEDAMAARVPALLRTSLRMLAAVGGKARPVKAVGHTPKPSLEERTDRTLRAYKGDPTPPPLKLPGLDGRTYNLNDYRGKVVLVNFWATWCPPCVHEMPSIQRLKNKLSGKPFQILAVNMAEQRATVEEFLRKIVHVDFRILLDSDGEALGRWKVFAFPTTYVVDKRGHIRYALFGSIDWDNADVVSKIHGLLAE